MSQRVRHAFASSLPYTVADAALYRRLKGVVPIDQEAPDPTDAPGIAPDETNADAWPFWHARLAAAANGGACGSRFPGSVLPGPGAGSAVERVGSLAYDRFCSAIRHPHGMIRSDDASFATRAVPVEARWPWKGIEQPPLVEVAFDTSPEPVRDEAELAADVARVRPDADGIRLAHRLWCPGRAAPEIPERLLAELVERFPAARDNPVPFAWELEEFFGHRAEARTWNGHGHGFWNGFWLEVGVAPIDRIFPTELAVGKRLAAELVTLSERGFAPLVVNEYGCDTDGTHRLLAAWLFNLCRALDPAVLADRARRLPHLRERAVEWVGGRLEPFHVPRPLLVREGLRFLAEAVNDAETWSVLLSVCRRARQAPAIRVLPTTFLREGTWETVVKREYDVTGRSVRVDPRVYAELAKNPNLVLPARGPYHRTDRALLPWFDVLAINRV